MLFSVLQFSTLVSRNYKKLPKKKKKNSTILRTVLIPLFCKITTKLSKFTFIYLHIPMKLLMMMNGLLLLSYYSLDPMILWYPLLPFDMIFERELQWTETESKRLDQLQSYCNLTKIRYNDIQDMFRFKPLICHYTDSCSTYAQQERMKERKKKFVLCIFIIHTYIDTVDFVLLCKIFLSHSCIASIIELLYNIRLFEWLYHPHAHSLKAIQLQDADWYERTSKR